MIVCASALACEPRVTQIGTWVTEAGITGYAQYLEAEDAMLSGGFESIEDETASSEHSLVPPAEGPFDVQPGGARAVYTVEIPETGNYVIWGRIRSPGASQNRFWFQVDGGDWIKWRISVGDIWYWDSFHDDADYDSALTFELRAGTHQLTLANCVAGVALDQIYISSNGDEPKGNTTRCNPPHSIELAGECIDSCGTLGGNACGATECAGRELLTAYDCDVCCVR